MTEKTYHADPKDHDAVARALLAKLHDSTPADQPGEAPPIDADGDEGECVLMLIKWHSTKVEMLRGIQAAVKAGTTVKVEGQGDGIKLSEREALAFRLGVEAVLAEIGKLPLRLEPFDLNEEDEDADDDTGAGEEG